MRKENNKINKCNNEEKNQQNLLISIIESTDDAIIGKTPEGIITSWNAAAKKIYGYSAEEVMGKSISILESEEKKYETDNILKKIIMGKRIEHYETIRRRKDGKSIVVSLTVSPILNSSGDLLGVSSIARDITSQKTTQEKLRLTNQYARSLIEASLDPLVTISPEGKITDVNEATVKATGISRGKLIGTDFSDYFTEPQKAREGYQKVFANGSVTDYPLTIRHQNGKLMEVLYNATVYHDSNNNVLGVFAAARDVTALKQAESKIGRQRILEEQRKRELEKLRELERFQNLVVGRELKMVELKKEIENLKEEISKLRKP
jgi:PAS domain S-box-containing protein